MTQSTPNYYSDSELILAEYDDSHTNISNTAGPFIDTNGILCLGNYYPYWKSKYPHVKNADFDDYSGLILDIKNEKSAAINEFIMFHENFQLFGSVALATVPSSKATKIFNGIRNLVMGWYALEDTYHRNNNVFDLTDLFRRYKSIESSHSGGERTIKTHMDSIKATYTLEKAKQLQRERPQPPRAIYDDVPLWIIDDVTTSGSSLLACRKIALRAGFRNIVLMALGKTVRND